MSFLPTQPERTALAEHRTGAAILVVSFILLRAAVVEGSPAGTATAAAALAISVAELALARHGYRRPDGRWPRAALASATAVALVSMAGIIVSLG